MSGLFGEKPKKPEPVRMPLPDEDDKSRIAAAEQRRKISQRSGRASTMLSRRSSQRTGEAGTSSYSNSLLGQAG
jgi:hypothetical protein